MKDLVLIGPSDSGIHDIEKLLGCGCGACDAEPRKVLIVNS